MVLMSIEVFYNLNIGVSHVCTSVERFWYSLVEISLRLLNWYKYSRPIVGPGECPQDIRIR